MKKLVTIIDRRLRAGLALLAAGALCSSPILADQIVYFVNGKAMTVKSIEKGAKFSILEVDGGGRVGIPTDQILRVEDLETVSPYVAQAPAPQAVVPPPAAIPALAVPAGATRPEITPTAGGPPLAAAGPTGPGIGGRPDPALSSVRPIELGGSPAGGMQRPQPGPAYGGLGAAGRLNGVGGGAMQQPGAQGARRFGGPAMGGRRAGMGRPRPELDQAQRQQAPAPPEPQPTPSPSSGSTTSAAESGDSGSSTTDDNSPETQDSSQDAPEQGAENTPPVD